MKTASQSELLESPASVAATAAPEWSDRISEATRIRDNSRSSTQEIAEGLRLMELALEMRPDSLLSYTLYADLFLRAGRIRDALTLLELALERDVPGSAAVWSSIAILYDLGGSPAAAIASFEQALEAEPENTNLLHGYINLLIRAKRYDEARYQLSQLDHRPTMALLLYKMAESMIDHPDETQWLALVTEAEALLVGTDELTHLHAAMMTSNLALMYPGDDESLPTRLYRKALEFLRPYAANTGYPDTYWSLVSDLHSVLGDEMAAENARRQLTPDPTN